MYLYIYDSFLKDKKYEIALNKIEARLSDLGISGRTAKMTILKNMKETIEDGVKKGAETVVAVGDDQTLFDVIRIIAGNSVTIGFIPVGKKSSLAEVLDIPKEEKACDVLSARLIAKLDIGKINSHYFLSSVEAKSGQVSIECDGHYWVVPQSTTDSVSIRNLDQSAGVKHHSDPQDGMLEAVISPQSSGGFAGFWRKTGSGQSSVFPARRLKIVSRNESVPLLVDGENMAKTPATVQVVPRKLTLIVGKHRVF